MEPRVGTQAGHRRRRSARSLVTGLAWAWWPLPGQLPPDRPRRAEPVHLRAPDRPERSGRTAPGPRTPRPSSPATGPFPWARLPSAAWPAGRRCRRPSPAGRPSRPRPTRSSPWCWSRRDADAHGDRTPDPAGPDRPPSRPSPNRGCSPSTSPSHPRRATTRPPPTTPPTTPSPTTSPSPWCGPTGDEVLNVNEAHAYASCSNCVTVAVAFQVVLIMDDAQVVVPQNLAVAANYECYRCITAAIASQLVLSVEETPGRGAAARPRRGLGPADRVRPEHHDVLARGDRGASSTASRPRSSRSSAPRHRRPPPRRRPRARPPARRPIRPTAANHRRPSRPPRRRAVSPNRRRTARRRALSPHRHRPSRRAPALRRPPSRRRHRRRPRRPRPPHRLKKLRPRRPCRPRRRSGICSMNASLSPSAASPFSLSIFQGIPSVPALVLDRRPVDP